MSGTKAMTGFFEAAPQNPWSAEDPADPPSSFMPDAEGMKKKLREQMCKPKYNVGMYYHNTGFTQWIARHPRFEQLTLIIIGLNAIWIWIDTDHNPAAMLLESPAVFQMAEHFFCLYFTFEWSMRFGAFEKKCNGLRDAWFVFDSLLVATMVLETWLMTTIMVILSTGDSAGTGMGNAGILRIARLLRLTRMMRMARLLRAMPELLIMIKGMIEAMRSVAFALGLLFVMLYVFGIAFVQLCEDSPCEDFFPDVPSAMHELLLNAALMDGLSNLVHPLKEQNLVLLFLLYAFIFLSALTVMNMLIGVICEVVSAVAATEREALSLTFVHEKIRKLLSEAGADDDNDQTISKEEFMRLLENPKAIAILQDVGVDVVGLVDFKDTFFENDACNSSFLEDDAVVQSEEKQLTVSDLMGLVLDLRGGNGAKVKDIVNLRKYINGRFSAMETKFARSSRSNSGPFNLSTEFSKPTRSNSGPSTFQPVGTCHSIPEEQEVEMISGSANPCSLPRLESSPRFQDMFHCLQGMMSVHEVQVATIESENRKLKEQVARMARAVRRSSPSEACASGTELDVTPSTATVIAPCMMQQPKGPAAEFRTTAFLSSSALRIAAEGSPTDSGWKDDGAANITVSTDSAAGECAAFSPQRLAPSQRPVPQVPKEAGTAAIRNVVVASPTARTAASEGVKEP